MSIIQSCSRRCLWWTFLIMLALALIFDIAGFFVWHTMTSAFPVQLLNEVSVHSEAFRAGLDRVLPLADMVKTFYIPSVSAVFILFWVLLWAILRSSMTHLFQQSGDVDRGASASGKKDRRSPVTPEATGAPVVDKKEMVEANKRFYLHLLTLLQREGRLIDFFAEDLSAYDDAQIGAAVRSIQDNCKSTLKKHLNPKAVMDQDEGDEIIVPSDFDQNAIKLTGNVSGDPPFRGILRHKGWRASKLELPTLSAARDSHIIAPAEIEIL